MDSQFITIIDGRVINSEPKTVNKCHLLGDWSYKIFFQAAESEQYVLVETVHTWKISLIRACIQVLKRVKWGGGMHICFNLTFLYLDKNDSLNLPTSLRKAPQFGVRLFARHLACTSAVVDVHNVLLY